MKLIKPVNVEKAQNELTKGIADAKERIAFYTALLEVIKPMVGKKITKVIETKTEKKMKENGYENPRLYFSREHDMLTITFYINREWNNRATFYLTSFASQNNVVTEENIKRLETWIENDKKRIASDQNKFDEFAVKYNEIAVEFNKKYSEFMNTIEQFDQDGTLGLRYKFELTTDYDHMIYR